MNKLINILLLLSLSTFSVNAVERITYHTELFTPDFNESDIDGWTNNKGISD